MKIKKVNLFAPKWWNPLYWVVVVFGPVLGMIAGAIAGAFCGLLMGYEAGLDVARCMLHKTIVKLP